MDTKNQAQQSITIEDLECFSALSDDEKALVDGGFGWNDIKKAGNKIKEGVRDYYSGVADGLNGQPRQKSNFNYLPGYIGGSIVNKGVEAIPG